jgi:ribosomal subunit interface protein
MQIHWTYVDEIDDAQREAAEARLEKLGAGHDDLIDIRITGSKTQHHQHGQRGIRITCQARGREIVATRERAELSLALDECLDVFEREVKRLREKRRDRRTERPPLPPELGVVDRVFRDDGYGFVLTDSGDQVYFHRNALSGLAFEGLAEGTRVGLNIEAGDKGPQATVVTPAPPDAPTP